MSKQLRKDNKGLRGKALDKVNYKVKYKQDLKPTIRIVEIKQQSNKLITFLCSTGALEKKGSLKKSEKWGIRINAEEDGCGRLHKTT